MGPGTNLQRAIGAAASLVAWLALVPTPAGAQTGAGAPARPPVRITVSNMRYCLDAVCEPSDQAYARFDGGPITGTDNPAAFIPVRPGDTVIWTYRDTAACDAINLTWPATCPGHEVQFERGPVGRRWVGIMPARKGEVTVTWQVPETLHSGQLLRYFCDTNDHWVFGLTGALLVSG